jgi:ElaB/YqjD/DUF883 family membrane-anchored ribosome-binding protein
MSYSTNTERNVNEVVGNAKAAYDTASNAANDLSHQAANAAAHAGAAVRDAAGRVSEAAADLGDKMYQRGRQAGEQVTKHVEAQPLSSILVAGAAGFVVGMLMARR